MGQDINVDLSNIPDCIGKSCDDNYYNTDEGKKTLEKLLSSQGMTECTPSEGSSTFNSASLNFMSKTTLVGGGFLLVLLLSNMLL